MALDLTKGCAGGGIDLGTEEKSRPLFSNRRIDDQRESLPSGAVHRATTLYSVGPRAGPDHDAVMRIGGEAPGRRAHSRKRYRHHGLLRVTATSDRQRRPTISCSSASACPCLRLLTRLARRRQLAPRHWSAFATAR